MAKNNSFLLSPSISGKLKRGISLAIAVLITTSLITYATFNNAVNEMRMVNRSNEVKTQIEVIISSLKDAETGVRGFLLTQDSSFLQPYKNAHKETKIAYQELKNLIDDNPAQQTRLQALSLMIEPRFLYLDSLLSNYRTDANNLKASMTWFKQGKKIMDQAREIVQHMREDENYTHVKKAEQVKETIQKSQIVIIIFLATAIAIIALSFYLIFKSLKLIQEKEKIYRNIFEYSQDLLCICKSDFSIIEANPGFIKAFGFEKDAERIIFPHHFFAEANDAKFIRETISKGVNVQQKQLSFTGAHGELHVCLGSFILIDKAKKIYSVVLTDITHQMQLQREREALERFANIGKVSRVLAHEVRNPLTNINLAIEGLFEECKETRFHDYFSIIYRNSLRINKLITELLNSTRPTVLEYGKVDIKALLEETLSLAKDRIELQHITIEKNVDDNLPEINGDKKKLIIAFLNIIINAIEAMPKINGLLKINAAASKNQLMAISITDNGSGMSEEIMEGIFQPFFTQKSNGTGLGLASTQNIILTHKGKVEVKSQLGQGTTFIVYLPLN